MRSRAPALVAVVAFASAVAVVAVLAGNGGQKLVKLPVSSLGGVSADAATGTALTRGAMAYAGPVEYRVEGQLPDLASTAPAYRLGSATSTAAVSRLATALGLDGEVKADRDGWLVRSGDRELRVAKARGLPWYLGQGCPDAPVSSDGQTVSCATAVDVGTAAGTGGVVSPGPSGSPASPAPPVCKGGTVECLPAPAPTCPSDLPCAAPAPDCPPDARCVEPAPFPSPEPPQPVPAPEKPARAADLPSEVDARRLARDVFARLGAGTDGVVVEDGWLAWEARVGTKVDGLPVIGMDTGVSIGAKGAIVRAYGHLAAPDRIGDYPLVGAEAGLRRLTGGFGGGPRPLVATGGGASTDGASTDGQIEPGVPGCGDPTAGCVPPSRQAPTVQVVTGVHPALLQSGDVLVPAYVFELRGGGTLPVPAVTDEWLEQQAPVAIVED